MDENSEWTNLGSCRATSYLRGQITRIKNARLTTVSSEMVMRKYWRKVSQVIKLGDGVDQAARGCII
jgi:hypothetical protein